MGRLRAEWIPAYAGMTIDGGMAALGARGGAPIDLARPFWENVPSS